MFVLNVHQRNAINAGMRQLTTALYAGGFAGLVQDMLNEIAAGNVGINSNAWDVDALSLGGGAFAQDEANTTGTTFAYFGGRVFNGATVVDVVAGTIALTVSTTNYIEVSRAGSVTKNTTGFTSGSLPLYVIVTSGDAIVSVTNKKTLLTAWPNTITHAESVATVTATGRIWEIIAPCTGRLSGLGMNVSTTLTASDSNYWTLSGQNRGPSGSGTTALLAATDHNTTKSTSPGSGFTADVTRVLTLHGTASNLAVTKGDLLVISGTETGTPADLVTPKLTAEFVFTS